MNQHHDDDHRHADGYEHQGTRWTSPDAVPKHPWAEVEDGHRIATVLVTTDPADELPPGGFCGHMAIRSSKRDRTQTMIIRNKRDRSGPDHHARYQFGTPLRRAPGTKPRRGPSPHRRINR